MIELLESEFLAYHAFAFCVTVKKDENIDRHDQETAELLIKMGRDFGFSWT